MTPEKLDEIAARDKAWREMEPGAHGEMWTREGLAEAYFMACYDRRVLLRREAALREALDRALRELGVPDENYPAPVANAVDILNDALLSEVPQ